MIALWKLAWAAEATLETSGAILARRQRLDTLFYFLTFSAASDAVTAILKWKLGNYVYEWATWASEAIGDVFLCFLACQLIARMMRDYQRIARYAGLLACVLGGVAGYFFNRGETWKDQFLDAEIAASCLLLFVLVVAWITAEEKLEWPFDVVCLGAVVSMAGNAGCAWLYKHPSTSAFGQSFYPVPALVALLLWNIAGLRRKRPQIRLETVTPRFPVVSEGLNDEDERFLRSLRIRA